MRHWTPAGRATMLRAVIAERADRRIWYVVAALVLLAGLLRFHDLGDEGGLWLDESWSVMNASGKGKAMDRLAAGVVQRPGADWTEVGSVPWTAIWPNTTSDVHPPGFYLLLRAWMGVFGQADLAIRSMAVAFSLAAMPVMFVVARETVGQWRAALALGLYAVSCGGIFFAQECRSYTMLQFWLVCLALVAWRIATRGATAGRLAGLCGLLFAASMTHYFFAGAAGGIVAWALVCARRGDRWKIAAAAGAAAALFGGVWGPFLWRQRDFWGWKDHLLDRERSPLMLALRFFAAPARMLLPNAPIRSYWTFAVGGFALAGIPALSLVARPDLRRGVLLWWAYLIGGIGFVLAEDIGRHGMGLEVPRYVSQLMPALCVLLAGIFPAPGWPREARVALLAPAAICAAFSSYWTWEYAYLPKGRWRDDVAKRYVPQMGPSDVIVFHSDVSVDWRPKMQYLCFSRYEGPARQLPHLVLLGPDAPTGEAAAVLARAERAWVFSMRDASFPAPNLGPLRQEDAKPIAVMSAESPLSLRLMSPVRPGATTRP